MSRIQGVSDAQAGPVVRAVYRQVRRDLGRVVEPVRVTAHHPRMLFGYGMLELALKGSHKIDEHLKALAELKAAAMAGCEFCMDIGSKISRESGITERQLRELHRHRESDAFDAVERLVLDFAAGMTRTPVDVSDELVAALREHFDEPQLVELASAIATENYRARFNWAFRLGSEGFSAGAFCVPPERPAATPPVVAANGAATPATPEEAAPA